MNLKMFYQNYTKPFFDRLLAFMLIFVGFLPFLVVFLLVFFDNKSFSKIFFLQLRVGKNEKPFYIYKFRTMNEEKDIQQNLLHDNARTTKIGFFLRKTHLDELPQIIQIFLGKISFVGPRPLLPEYLERYTPFQALRHNVLPGMTGWAQINGGANLPLDQKADLDAWYVQNISFLLDLKILWKTFFR